MWRTLSLRHKLLSVTLLVLVCTGSSLVGLVVVGAERAHQRQAMRSARALTGAIDRTLRSAMLSGKREVVRAAVSTLAERTEVSDVAVHDRVGERVTHAGTYSDMPAAVRRLVAEARATDRVSTARIGDTAYAVVSPVRSNPACARCHGSETRLGFISAIVSTAELEHVIQVTRDRLLWGGLVLLAVTCLAIYFGVSCWVERPVTKLTRMVDSVRDRDRIGQAGVQNDEVARLDVAFRAMMAEIDQKTQSLLKAERDLAHSQRLASIGLLAAGIAHEIGSPLSTIQLQAGFWHERGDGLVQAAAGTIMRAAKQVGELQRELLTFDRRETLQWACCDLRLLVRGCLGLVESPLLRCYAEMPEVPLIVEADQALLARALSNILSNAVQAMQGEGTLTVILCERDDNWVEMVIRDTGPGIVAENLPHVFEPFFTRKTDGRGSGLGLAIAREIVARHNGEITAEAASSGACFRILLPLTHGEEMHGSHPDSGR